MSLSSNAMRWLAVLLLALAGALWPGKAVAASNCWSNDSLNIAFGEVDAAGKNTSDTLTITCQRDLLEFTRFRLCLSIPDGSPITGVNPRWMTNYNGAQMSYDLYSDAARTQIIGPYGSAFPTYSTTLDLSGLLVTQKTVDMPVYARAHPGQSLSATYPFQSQINGGQVRYSYNTGLLASTPSVAQCLSGNGTTGSGIVNSIYTGVSATFANTCHLSTATDLDFGNVTNLTSAQNQVSTISLQCPNGTAWKLGLDNGSNASGSTRRMRNGSNYLSYELYRDNARTQRWGNTPGTDTVNNTGTNATQSVTVYGRVPAQAVPAAGTYSDTVTVTLTF